MCWRGTESGDVVTGERANPAQKDNESKNRWPHTRVSAADDTSPRLLRGFYLFAANV